MNDYLVIETEKLTFIIADSILVKTKLQSFYLTPADNRKTRLGKIRIKIEAGEITCLEELSTACGEKTKWIAKV